MHRFEFDPTRRTLIRLIAGATLSPLLSLPTGLHGASRKAITKTIPSSGERLPAIGLGTSRTFDVSATEQLPSLAQVLGIFFGAGGTLIDSSPMYGEAERVIGELLAEVPSRPLFAATKVWTRGRQRGISQMETSRSLWRIPRFDLIQVHNLLDWQIHLETLREWKAQNKIRYIGITTSHGRDHDELERILENHPLDFVQFSYSMGEREAEQRLLPLAKERGIAVIANRPFQRGSLFHLVKNRPLPSWAGEFDCHSWGQFFLKFVISHPGITCAIPATSNPKHMQDNMGAMAGRLPDLDMRKRMLAFLED